MRCPICDTENAPGLTVCDMCGAELPEMKECKGCGAIIPKSSTYCPKCKRLSDINPASSTSDNTPGMTTYYVGLDYVGDDRPEVIKVIQRLRNCEFEEARDVVDGDGIVLTDVPKLEAEIAVSKLRGAGAKATMEPVDGWDNSSSSTNSRSVPARNSNRASSSAPVSSKSKIVAGLLALFLGGWGIHNFYLGHTMKGVLQLLLCWTGISSIWAFIEMIMIFTGSIGDSNGNPLA